MTRTAFCMALVIILLVPSVPWATGENEMIRTLDWEPIEKYEGLPQSLKVWIEEDNEDRNDRYDLLVIDVVLKDPSKLTFIVFSTISSGGDRLTGEENAAGIQQIHTLKEGESHIRITYNGTDLFLGEFRFPYLLELQFVSDTREGGLASYRILGDYSYLKYESPLNAGFDDTISYRGIPGDGGVATGFSELEVTLNMFTRVEGNYTIVAELLAKGVGSPGIGIPRILKDGDIKPVEEVDPKIESERSGEENPDVKSERSEDPDVNGEAKGGAGTRGETQELDIRGISATNLSAVSDPQLIGSIGGQVIESIILPVAIKKSGELQQKLTISFLGENIHASYWKGPFLLSASIYQGNKFVDSGEWIIEDVLYSDYEEGKVLGTFTSGYGVEGTSTGMNVTVKVSILQTDTFLLTAEVYSHGPQKPVFVEYIGDISGTTGYVHKDAYDGIAENGRNANDFDDGIPHQSITRKMNPGTHSVTFSFDGVFLREELFVSLTITSLSTGGTDFLDLHLKPTEPAPTGFITIEDSDLKDLGVDQDGDKLFDHLLVKAQVDLPDGTYVLEAKLFARVDGHEYEISTEVSKLKVKQGSPSSEDTSGNTALTDFAVRYPGEDIFLSGIDGPYIIIIYLTPENGTTYVMKGPSHEYQSVDFSPLGGRKEPGSEPEYSFTNKSIFLHTDVFASEILRNNPELVYYYYTDMGESIKFRVRFTRLIAYNDDGDGILEDGEGEYEAFLSTRTWTTSPVSHGINSQLGSHLRFSMSTTISLQAMRSVGDGSVDVEGGNGSALFVPNWGRLTLHFLISNNSVIGTNFTIRGGEELKITVEITPYKHLDINAVAIEQKILLEKDGRIVSTDEANGGWGTDPVWDGPEATTNGSSRDCQNGSNAGLSYTNDLGEIMGYYSWDCTAVQELVNGSSLRVDVGSSSTTSNGIVILYLSYPISDDVRSLVHDPSVGVLRENAPILSISTIKDNFEANPWSYLLGLIMASLVVTVTLGTGRKGKGRGGKEGGMRNIGTPAAGQDQPLQSEQDQWKRANGGFDPPPGTNGNTSDPGSDQTFSGTNGTSAPEEWKPPLAPHSVEQNEFAPKPSIRPEDLLPTNDLNR